MCHLRQETRSTKHVNQILYCNAFANRWAWNCSVDNLDTLRGCFQLVLERARERVVAGCQIAALVVSHDSECFPLTSCLICCESSEHTQPNAAGPTVTCLVLGPAGEIQRVGCCFDPTSRSRVIEIPDPLKHISTPQPAQELVHPLTLALIHKNKPTAHPCFDRYSREEMAQAVG